MNRRIDAARQAGSQTAQNTRDLLSKYGLANSAFGARMLAEETGNINQRVADVPADVTQEILNQAPGVATSVAGLGSGMLGTAAGLDINRSSSSSGMDFGASLSDLLPFLGGLKTGGGAGSAGSASSPIAAGTAAQGIADFPLMIE